MSERLGPHNYEAWLLDQLDGQLTAEQERELEAFLIAHPQFRPSDEALPKVDADSARLPDTDRDALKRMLPPTGSVNALTLHDHLIARHEGDLNPEQEQALTEFLRSRPTAQRTDRQYAHARITPEPIALSNRGSLHRALPPAGRPTLGDLDDFLVARLEGDLSTEQERALDELFAEHEQARKEWALVKATRIAPETIMFSGKPGLKRSAKVIAIGAWGKAWRLAAAASVALLLGLGWWWSRSEGNADPGFAHRGTTIPKAAQQPHPEGGQPDERGDVPVSDSIVEPIESSAPVHHQPQERQVIESPLIPEPAEPLPPAPEPEDAPMAHVPDEDALAPEPNPRTEDPSVLAQADAVGQRAIDGAVPTMGQALTGAVRERLLALEAEPTRPLDATDAEAAADRALRAVAGDRAGFVVKRDGRGRSRGFDLRLGRHMGLSARR